MAIAARIRRDGCRVHAPPEYYRASQEGYAKRSASAGYEAAERGEHAGADTSLALASTPRWCARNGGPPQHAGRAPGVTGDPRRASAELAGWAWPTSSSATVAAIRERTGAR